jgi:hypothetical protein
VFDELPLLNSSNTVQFCVCVHDDGTVPNATGSPMASGNQRKRTGSTSAEPLRSRRRTNRVSRHEGNARCRNSSRPDFVGERVLLRQKHASPRYMRKDRVCGCVKWTNSVFAGTVTSGMRSRRYPGRSSVAPTHRVTLMQRFPATTSGISDFSLRDTEGPSSCAGRGGWPTLESSMRPASSLGISG